MPPFLLRRCNLNCQWSTYTPGSRLTDPLSRPAVTAGKQPVPETPTTTSPSCARTSGVTHSKIVVAKASAHFGVMLATMP
jgi:hypothetical protein